MTPRRSPAESACDSARTARTTAAPCTDVSYNYEFLGDIESCASLGDKSARMERSLDGGWFSYGIGAQANISKTWSAYGELERTSGGDVENPWRWSVGVRHVF